MIKHSLYVAMSFLIAALFLVQPSFALNGIVRPYQSPRTSALGGARITTGLYEENFFGNPARVTDNPKWKVQLPDPTFEFNVDGVNLAKKISDLLKSDSDPLVQLSSVTEDAGKNGHLRYEMTFPSIYVPHLGKMSYALGLITSIQTDFDLRRSYQADLTAFGDVGPVLSVGRKIDIAGVENALAVGINIHAMGRISSNRAYDLISFTKGQKFTFGRGINIDGDLGGTYLLPVTFQDWSFTTGLAINNVAGGRYKTFGSDSSILVGPAAENPRTLGFGGSAHKSELWKFTDAVFALEFTDIGNNTNGSLFRTVHLGGEVRYGVLSPRLGLNQGYFTGGLGVNLKVLTLDLATYGEEMGLNVGSMEDRRYVVRLAFQI